MQTQKTLSGLHRGTPLTLERLRSSLRRRRKRRSWTSPFRMKPQNQLLLLGLIIVILNLTSVSTQDNVFISWIHSYADFHNTSNCCVCGALPLSVMDGLPWWVSPFRQGDFKPLCSFLGQQKETFLSLVNHNLSLLSWYKPDLQSIDSGHGVTFDVNTSFIEVTKSYTSYLKNKKEKSSLTSKGGQASRYVKQFYQVWDEYFWMTPEKGELITPAAIFWEQKEQRVGFSDLPLDPKELTYMGYLSPEQTK